MWKLGGDGTVHSSVVAPTPQGFDDDAFFVTKEYNKFIRNTTTPATDIYEPIEEITFHPAYLLRLPDQKKYSWEDLKIIKKKIEELQIKI